MTDASIHPSVIIIPCLPYKATWKTGHLVVLHHFHLGSFWRRHRETEGEKLELKGEMRNKRDCLTSYTRCKRLPQSFPKGHGLMQVFRALFLPSCLSMDSEASNAVFTFRVRIILHSIQGPRRESLGFCSRWQLAKARRKQASRLLRELQSSKVPENCLEFETPTLPIQLVLCTSPETAF